MKFNPLALALVCAVSGPALLAQPALAAKKSAAAVNPERAAIEKALDDAIAGTHRAAGDKARDVYRHPKETLLFMGVRPDATVVEISPGTGWYSAILAPLLRERGKLVLAASDPNGPGRAGLGSLLAMMGASPPVYDRAQVVTYNPMMGILDVTPGTADVVVTFRHVHGLMMRSIAPQAFKSYFDALKPGGILGIEQHRAPEESTLDPASGYVKQSAVIAAAEAAGFKFLASSDVNANAKDDHNHPEGVWSLPPTLRNAGDRKAEFEAIGESDRMTLKFVKP
jgi:predicted methyltransferase